MEGHKPYLQRKDRNPLSEKTTSRLNAKMLAVAFLQYNPPVRGGTFDPLSCCHARSSASTLKSAFLTSPTSKSPAVAFCAGLLFSARQYFRIKYCAGTTLYTIWAEIVGECGNISSR
jgi:hypothetical protein